MRSPEHRKPYQKRQQQPGHTYNEELNLRYLAPGAFTILPPEDVPPQDPPLAPQPYRLTPQSKRHKNLAFAILAEPSDSRPGSRSPSPSGRVSPFRGRGFNPAGSRHASPAPSPPPEDQPASNYHHHQQQHQSYQHDDHQNTSGGNGSKIPKLSRRGSVSVFGEKIADFQTSPNKRKQLSQSLNNIDNAGGGGGASTSRRTGNGAGGNRPPPSPRRPQGHKPRAFQRLSPIAGSSPEPSQQSQSSPSRIPKTRSQPQSRFTSPTRNQSTRPPRSTSRPVSRAPSRGGSREASPGTALSPVRKNYRNIQAKVNSFNSIRPKPKVPPKPQQQVLNNNNDQKKPLERKGSVIKTNTLPNKRVNNKNNSSVRNGNKTTNNNNNNNNNSTNNTTNSVKNGTNTNNSSVRNSNNGSSTSNVISNNGNRNKVNGSPRKNQAVTTTTTDEASTTNYETSETEAEAPVRLSDLLQPSTEAVVSTTTEAVTKPLKIEAKPEVLRDSDNKTIAPMVDGRVLSATSVSNAMNKMNDSVLDTKTLMKDTGMNKLSPAATTIISMSGSDNAKSTMPSVETTKDAVARAEERNVGGMNTTTTNHVSDNNGGIIPARVLDQHVQNNMSRLVAPDHTGNSVQKSANERIKEARTVVAADVKPIRITVKERAGDVEVQSGNVRIPVDATNGLSERPGLPPAQPTANDQSPPPEPQDAPKPNVCSRFFTSLKNKITGAKPSEQAEEKSKQLLENEEQSSGCFGCAKKNKKPDVTINIEDENGENPKFWHKFKCWGKNKVGDSTGGCCPTKRKESWSDRQDSIMSDAPPKRSRCRSFWRKVFCLDCCCKSKKKPVEEDRASRRASLMSKKKSLTPSVPAEDNTPTLDMSLVEHTSTMKGAIPVLPVYLAWFCLVMNCIAPGTGTIFSGMFCLCIGIPRFSQKDGPRPRIGSFLINIVIGIGQCFTVLFCLVGWGWSIWWGVIMLRMARKHQKIKAVENLEAQQTQQQQQQAQSQASRNQRTTADQNHRETAS